MTIHDLHDAIGLLDEELLEQTDRLRTAPRKRMLPIRRYWAAAACLAMLLCGTLAFWFVNNALRCGSAAPAQFSLKSAPMENAAEAQNAAEDAAAPTQSGLTSGSMEDAAAPQSPMENAAPESGEDPRASASGSNGMDQGELSQPPALVVGTVTLASGNYTWTVQQEDGSAQTTAACGVAPTDYIEKLPMLDAKAQTVTLEWAAVPMSVTVRCWQAGKDQEQEAVLDGNTLFLQPGDWVYEVCADFDQGQASYTFRAVWE